MGRAHYISLTALLAAVACAPTTPAGGKTEALVTQALPVLEILVDANITQSNVTDVATCVASSASVPELSTIADAANNGITQETVELVFDISVRQQSVSCIEGLGLTRV